MNIFVLDEDPFEAARMHCDKHVVKMPLEAAQMLCTVHRHYGSDDHRLYKSTHKHHPCTLWAADNTENYRWLYQYFHGLNDEYFHRYYRDHHSWTKLKLILKFPPPRMPHKPMTPFAQAMPDEYKCDDAVTAYRNYYRYEKKALLQFKNRDTPDWLPDTRVF